MILDDIVAHKRTEVEALLTAFPHWERETPPVRPRRDFAAALSAGGVRVIAEFKRRSPAAGALNEGADPGDCARRYARAGASALSVLTDNRFFGGALADLDAAAGAAALPVLRKDFIIHPVQVWQSAQYAADAVLLIVAALVDAALRDLLARVGAAGMQALVEVHTEGELDRALAAGARIIGINNRDLRTFKVDLGVTARLRPRIPADRIVVSESGIRTRADIERLAGLGVHAALIGEALMSAPDPEALLAELLGRTPVPGSRA